MSPSHQEVRQYLVDEIIKDSIGPSRPDEELTDRPTVQYQTGILYPQNTEVSVEEDDDSNEAADEDDLEEVDTGVLMATATNPSSIGMTFTVKKLEKIKIVSQAAIYHGVHDEANNRTIWQRKELEIQPITFEVSPTDGKKYKLAQDLALFIRVRERMENVVVTIIMMNTFATKNSKLALDSTCFFQPKITVTSVEETNPVFLARSDNQSGYEDPDRELNDLLYRYTPEYAIGHGCAVQWIVQEGQQATQIQTALIPSFEILQVSPDSLKPFQCLQMKFLATTEVQLLIKNLREFSRSYHQWIQDREAELSSLPQQFKKMGITNLTSCQQVADRIDKGIDLLETDALVREAFQKANQAMLVQRSRTVWIKMSKEERPAAPILSEEHRWRPFQLAFMLLCLPSISNPTDGDRSLVDLLWFPTGGGKTEAYLGLTAFTIFLRRLKVNGDPIGDGVTVLMRYTLRLLTIQQFQRAAALILACESIRRNEVNRLGKNPISLGLWVGKSATPNTLSEASKALIELTQGNPVFEGNPYQVHSCPWCGMKITPHNYRVGVTLVIQCPNPKCDYATGFPLYLVDEDIYKRKPSLLIGTVDKFARLPWLATASALFGRPGQENYPPELIIQDELHLISGPLGTLVGLYETAIDILCQKEGISPKIVASTATIRRAAEQIHGVFNRGLCQFPPPGLDARDSYFARQISHEDKPGRLYIGVHAPGKSMKTTLLRVYAVLLQKISEHQSDTKLRDPYWTLVGYFNSMRELGGTLRLVEDDIRERMRILSRRVAVNPSQRFLNSVRELNSRISSEEIPQILDLMSKGMDDPAALDVILATNMISVGVDVDRLGLMVVDGQPKMSAEYIQATSRVGRQFPGLVVTLFNWTRPRDRSHYERFVSYHASIYSHVEPTSVTPFASRARDRGLHSVLITLIRHLDPNMNSEDAAIHFDPDSPIVAKAIQMILERVAKIDPDEYENTKEELSEICRRWSYLTESTELIYGQSYENPDSPHLMEAAEKKHNEGAWAFPTLNSLRDVEGESGLFILKGGSH